MDEKMPWPLGSSCCTPSSSNNFKSTINEDSVQKLSNYLRAADLRHVKLAAHAITSHGNACDRLTGLRAATRLLDASECCSLAAAFLYFLMEPMAISSSSPSTCTCSIQFDMLCAGPLAGLLASSDPTARKFAAAAVRRATECNRFGRTWAEYCDLVEVLEEPQAHIVAPVLATLLRLTSLAPFAPNGKLPAATTCDDVDDINGAGAIWHQGPPTGAFLLAAFQRAMAHGNGWIRLWTVRCLLRCVAEDKDGAIGIASNSSPLLDLLLPKLNDFDIWNRVIEKNCIAVFMAELKACLVCLAAHHFSSSGRQRDYLHALLVPLTVEICSPSSFYFYSEIVLQLAEDSVVEHDLCEQTSALFTQVFRRASGLCSPVIRDAVRLNFLAAAARSHRSRLLIGTLIQRIAPFVSALPPSVWHLAPSFHQHHNDTSPYHQNAIDWPALEQSVLDGDAPAVLMALIPRAMNVQDVWLRLNGAGVGMAFGLALGDCMVPVVMQNRAALVLLFGCLPRLVLAEFGRWVEGGECEEQMSEEVARLLGPDAVLNAIVACREDEDKWTLVGRLCSSATQIWSTIPRTIQNCHDTVVQLHKHLSSFNDDRCLSAASAVCLHSLSVNGVQVPPVGCDFAARWTDAVCGRQRDSGVDCHQPSAARSSLQSDALVALWSSAISNEPRVASLLAVAENALPVLAAPAALTELLRRMADVRLECDEDAQSVNQWNELLRLSYAGVTERRKCLEHGWALAAWLRLAAGACKRLNATESDPPQSLVSVLTELMADVDANAALALRLAEFFLATDCEEWTLDYVTVLAIYGPAVSKAERVIDFAERRIFDGRRRGDVEQAEASTCFTQIGWIWQRVRATAIVALMKAAAAGRAGTVLRSLITRLNETLAGPKCKSACFAFSLGHRVRTRGCIAILALIPHLDQHDCETAFNWLIDCLIAGGQQPSVRLPCEIGLAKMLVDWPVLRHRLLWPLESRLHEGRAAAVGSWLAVAMHVARELVVCEGDEAAFATWHRCYLTAAGWRSSQNFLLRATALAAGRRMFTVLDDHALCDRSQLAAELRRSCELMDAHAFSQLDATGNQDRLYRNLLGDFYFGHFDFTHCNLVDISGVYMRQCGMPADEQTPAHVWLGLASLVNDKMLVPSRLDLEALPSAWAGEQEQHGAFLPPLVRTPNHTNPTTNTNHQLKTSTARLPNCNGNDNDNTNDTDDSRSRSRRRTQLIVVASLLTRPTNVGGVCRSCEVLGAGRLAVAGFGVMKTGDFKALSVSAEQWVDVVEVPPDRLIAYLRDLRTNHNYTVVGLEQTNASVPLRHFRFAEKTVLLLGAERTGIPAEMLAECDQTVEIEQLGVVRSLNVHTAAVLAMYEYVKQHALD